MSLINISNLTFSYDGSYDNIFENVSFQIDTDWKLGFTGRNGRGKTTFLKLLMSTNKEKLGSEFPDYEYRGVILASVSFSYFPFDAGDRTRNTSEIIGGICGDCHAWELNRELSLLEVSDDALLRPFNTLSYGEQTKILLAAMFVKENNFLLIDEPTNHLDSRAREIVSAYLKSKKGFILVSHDRQFMDNCVDHILSINKTNIEIQRGNFSSWLANKERADSFELAENERLIKDVKRLKQAARQSSEWADRVEDTKIGMGLPDRAYIGEKSRRMQQRRKNLERRQQTAIDEKSKLLKNIESADELKISSLAYHANRLVSLENAAIFYGDRAACKNVDFTVERGDRIALRGRNGSGKSSVIKLICGEDIRYTGSYYKAGGLVISYVSQDTSFLSGGLTGFAMRWGIDESLFKAILRKLDFSRVQFDKDMSDFSEGQKKKVLIAKSLCERAHLYVWDEPLNFIDVISRMQIEDLILAHKPTLLFVEHDAAFMEKIATKYVSL